MLFGGASYWHDMYGMLAVHEEVAEYVLNDQKLKSLPKDFYATRSYADFLMDAIRSNRHDGKPFLAYLAFTAPHDPMHAPEPWLSKYRSTYDTGYEALKTQRTANAKQLGLVSNTATSPTTHSMLPKWDSLNADEKALQARGMEVYDGMVDNMDYHLGRVINFLKDIGEYENIIIIIFFLSDNGPNPWSSEDYPGNEGSEGSEWFAQFDNSIDNLGKPMSHYAYGMGWGSASAGPFDLFKITVGEGDIRGPLLIAGPGIQASQQTTAFAYVWDLMPTLLDFASVQRPDTFNGNQLVEMRGKSLKPLLEGSKARIYNSNEYVGGEMQNGKWMRQGDYKAVTVAPPYGDSVWRLFNVIIDPSETKDLAKEQPAKLTELKQAWDLYAAEVGVILTK